jgi:hypothetical protein
MRCVWRIGVIITIVSLLMGATRPARSDPLLPDALASTFRRGAPGADIALYFSGVDLWRNGGTAYAGALWSPGGLNSDGFTLKLLLAAGDYLYETGPPTFGEQACSLPPCPDGGSSAAMWKSRSSQGSTCNGTICRRMIFRIRCAAIMQA